MSGLEQFKETYITECFELLSDMEEQLLGLEPNSDDLDAVNAIFRCAHSIKGGGGAFGFTQLVDFTHILEMLLDSMREGKILATQEVTDLLLQSVDVVNQMITHIHNGEEIPQGFGDDLKPKLEVIANSTGEIVVEASVEEVSDDGGAGEFGCYDIKFVPHRGLIASGNEPLLIIRELKRLGEFTAKINIDNIPPLDELDFEDCYLFWSFDLGTDEGTDAIKEAFEFVEGECDLSIEESGAITMPSAVASPSEGGSSLADDDEFGGIFADNLTEASPAASLADDDEFGGIFVENIPAEAEVSSSAPAAKIVPVAAPAVKAGQEKAPSKPPAVSTIRVDIEKVDDMVNMVGELVITQAMITQQTKDLPPEEFHQLIQGVQELARHTRELQESVMAVRMQPVKSVFARMPRLVRDLSRQLDKNIKIEMLGEATEIDKTVIEQLSDPLTHMIRNSVDHGVESPDVRKASGKPEQGTIVLSADNSGGRIVIEIYDDGGGVNREKVLSKAVEKGLVTDPESMRDEEIDRIIFMPGFSTADAVTDVSGRGVGMDVVRRNIEELGGDIEIYNTPGEGTKFIVSLPLTLAILDGMIVGVGGEKYIVPINSIIESLCPEKSAIKSIADGGDVLNVRGEFVPVVYLNNIFNVTNRKQNSRFLVVLVESGREKFGLVVDEIIGQQQVVIKSIEENTDPVDGVSGATILGDGNVALILDVAKLKMMTSCGIVEAA